MAANANRPVPGIEARHARSCATRATPAKRCNCTPSYRAEVWSPRDGKRIRETFPTIAAAKSWRRDAGREVELGTRQAPGARTLREAADEFIAGATSGAIRDRSGDVYKPSTIRGYAQALRTHVLPVFGAHKLSKVQRVDLQTLVDEMVAAGRSPSTIRNALLPVRVIYRRAANRGEVASVPTAGLELPAVRGKRDRIASPAEAVALLSATPEQDRALWATAFYAGLRMGELRALDWSHIDLKAGVIRVVRSYDPEAGFIETKTGAGRRTVPIPARLRAELIAHRGRTARAAGLAFGRTADSPFAPQNVGRRARKAWETANEAMWEASREKGTKLDPASLHQPITLHECRHTCASFLIASGANAKAVSTYMGHASITITFDRYGHLMPGSETEVAGLMDAFLAAVPAHS